MMRLRNASIHGPYLTGHGSEYEIVGHGRIARASSAKSPTVGSGSRSSGAREVMIPFFPLSECRVNQNSDLRRPAETDSI